ncbi:MAG: carbohydrate kinase [Clostridia bacterium]|nr:carbohydrate kinase [Clostridia bacterium]
MKKYDITALGEILIDFIPDGFDGDGDSRFIRKAGGAPFNCLAAAAKAGLNTAFIGKVGSDIHGRFLMNTVKDAGVDTCGISVDTEHNTTLAFVELDEKGDRDFSFYRTFGADRFISKDDIDPEMIKNSAVFHFGSLSLTDEPARSATHYAVKLAKESGCVVTYDPNYRAPLWKSEAAAVEQMGSLIEYVDICKMSVEEIEMISGFDSLDDAAKFIMEKGVKIVLVTDGPNGAYAYFGAQSVHFPAVDAVVVDTTGAGDIFYGTFISSFIKSGKVITELTFGDIKAFCEKAVYVSSKSTEKHGALASIKQIEI